MDGLQRALQLDHRALQINPNSFPVRGQESVILLGDASLKVGDRRAALEYYRRGASLFAALDPKGTRANIAVNAAVTDGKIADICLADGSRRRADVVIAATGYRRGLEPLVGHLGVLGDDGRPRVRGGATDRLAPRMWFTGFTNPISGMFRELGIDARRIARAVVRDRARASHRTVSPVLDALRASVPSVVPAKEPWRR